MPSPDPISWIKAISIVVKWPFKIMLIIFLICVALLTPWSSQIPDYAAIHDYIIWVVLVCGVSGLFVMFTAIEYIGKGISKPVGDWRRARAIDIKMRCLEDDEISILREYITTRAARVHIMEEGSSALRSLIAKGILTPAGEITGYWLDRLAFDLTPDANKSMRKESIREHLNRKIQIMDNLDCH
jgi:hypothetical protein